VLLKPLGQLSKGANLEKLQRNSNKNILLIYSLYLKY
jgi:hypothetical protein